MREIAVKNRIKVLKLYLQGLPYDNIALKAGVAKGSVVNIIKEIKEGRYPEFKDLGSLVEELRELSVSLKKRYLGVADAELGLAFYTKLVELDVEPSELRHIFILLPCLAYKFAYTYATGFSDSLERSIVYSIGCCS